MIPRFEVIDGYPNSPFDIGEIIDNWHNYPTDTNPIVYRVNKKTSVTETFFLETFKKYPNLFKALAWHDLLGISDFESLKYLKPKPEIVESNRVHFHIVRVININDTEHCFAIDDKLNKSGNVYFENCLPATLEEYNAYMTELDKPTLVDTFKELNNIMADALNKECAGCGNEVSECVCP